MIKAVNDPIFDPTDTAANDAEFGPPPMYKHQEFIADYWAKNPLMFNTSDPGTGKTRGTMEGFIRTPNRKRMLVTCPLSIMEPSWGADLRAFTELRYRVAHGNESKRRTAFESDADVVIINHDGIKWLAGQPDVKRLLTDFTHLAIDESTAYKNGQAQRSKAMLKVASLIPWITCMTGTPNSNTVLDLWHQVKLMDRGQRLGTAFYRFREQMCIPTRVGLDPHAVRWDDRPEAQEMVADLLKDITVRFRFEDCLDVPENTHHTITLDMPKWLRNQYEDLLENEMTEHEGEIITAAHAGAKIKKALQLLSGAVYSGDKTVKVHKERYELLIELCSQREATLIGYNWRHEVENLEALAKKSKLRYAIINGDTPVKKRTAIVEGYQGGEIDHVFAHPQAAGHGLTFTRGRSTIWSSPTYNAEHWEQFNRRIYRAGQKHKTETIRIAYADSHEIDVYNRLDGKLFRMTDLLGIFNYLTKEVT